MEFLLQGLCGMWVPTWVMQSVNWITVNVSFWSVATLVISYACKCRARFKKYLLHWFHMLFSYFLKEITFVLQSWSYYCLGVGLYFVFLSIIPIGCDKISLTNLKVPFCRKWYLHVFFDYKVGVGAINCKLSIKWKYQNAHSTENDTTYLETVSVNELSGLL